MVLGASLSYAAGALFVKRSFADANPVGVATATLAAGALLLAGPAVITVGPGDLTPPAPVVWSILALGLLSSGLAFWLWYALVREAGAGRASVITYVAPGVAVLAGVVVLDERATVATGIGLVLILAGSWLSTRGTDRD